MKEKLNINRYIYELNNILLFFGFIYIFDYFSLKN